MHRLEFVETADEVEKLVGPLGDKRRKTVQRVLRIDYAFIVVYTAFFVALAGLLAVHDDQWAFWAAIPIAIAAVIGGVLDFLENRQMSQVLRLRGMDMTPSGLRDLRWWARAKWFVMSLVVGALSVVFFLQGGWLLVVFGVVWALLGLTGLIGSAWKRSVLPWFLSAAVVVAVATCVLFVVAPGKFDGF